MGRLEFGATAQGSRVATSFGGVLTGRGADLIVLDDPLKFEEGCRRPSVVAATISLALFGRSITLLGASKAAAFVALVPVMAALMAIPALGECPNSLDWLAIGMITAGLYLASGAPVPRWTAKIPHARAETFFKECSHI